MLRFATGPLLAVALAAGLGILVHEILAKESASSASIDRPVNSDEIAALAAFDEFPLYFLGDSFQGLPLVEIQRVVGTPRPNRPVTSNYMLFVYGTCEVAPGSDTGCPVPLTVHVWPACERNPSVYEIGPGEPYPREQTSLRGVPAALFDEGTRLELYTGTVTIVLTSLDAGLLSKTAEALVPANAIASAQKSLPSPAQAALQGRLDC
jgi:hypothetical protein